jgi:hypothetical protein
VHVRQLATGVKGGRGQAERTSSRLDCLEGSVPALVQMLCQGNSKANAQRTSHSRCATGQAGSTCAARFPLFHHDPPIIHQDAASDPPRAAAQLPPSDHGRHQRSLSVTEQYSHFPSELDPAVIFPGGKLPKDQRLALLELPIVRFLILEYGFYSRK